MLRFKKSDGSDFPKWEICNLEEISSIYDGTHQTPNYVSYGVPFVSVENIDDIKGTDKYISNEAYDEFKVKPQINDIFMTRITAGIIGATYVVADNEPLGYYVSLALIRPKKNVEAYYLSYFINCRFFKKELHKRIIHTAFPKKINKEDIGKCVVKVPCIKEQEKISTLFLSVDEVISAIESEIALWEEKKKGVIQKIFSQEVRFKKEDGTDYPEWEEFYVEDICKIQTGSGNTQDKEDDGQYPFYVRSPIIEHSNRYIFDGEAVLTVGDGVGTGKVYHYVVGKFNYHQRVYAMTDFREDIKGKFFYYRFQKDFPKRVLAMSAKTSVDSVRREMIAKLKMPIPSIAEQKKIVDCLSLIDEIIEIKKQKLETWKTIKKGLLQHMFV